MKKNVSLIVLLFISSFVTAQSTSPVYRLVGYYPTYRFYLQNTIEFEKLTHVNLSFANPDASGNLYMLNNTEITSQVTYIHSKGPKVLVSIAGATLSYQEKQNYANLMKPENRAGFIAKIDSFLEANDLDGIDVDLEGSTIDGNYGGFVAALADSLQPKGYLVTAALARGTGSQVSSEAVEAFDFINIMSYDGTGPWNPNNAGPHSSYQMAVSDMQYWKNRGATKDQLVLGVPFYGYKFNNGGPVNTYTFSQIVSSNEAGSENVDMTNNTYYNGKFTMMDKTDYALVNGSGVMIWELGQDSFGQHSLLKVIHERIPLTTAIEDELEQKKLHVYPNPATAELFIVGKFEQGGKVIIYDYLGQSVHNEIVAACEFCEETKIDVSKLTHGSYVLRMLSGEKVYTSKFLK